MNERLAAHAATVVLCLGLFGESARADVFTLRDGTTIVGEVQSETKSEVVVLTLLGPQTLAREAIEQHEDRASILRRLEPLASHDNVPLERIVGLARIAAEKGLFEDALDALDRALSISSSVEVPPIFEQIPIGGITKDSALTPESVAQLIQVQSDRLRPGRLATASARLADRLRASGDPLPSPLVAALRRELESVRPEVRAATLRVIATTPVVELDAALVDHILRDPDPDVRRNTAQYAGRMNRQSVNSRLCRALESQNPALREAALDALEMSEDPHVVASLVRALADGSGGSPGVRASMSVTNNVSFVYDFDVDVATSAFIADPQVSVIQEGATLDATVLGVSERGPAPQQRARIGRVLHRLTGMSYGTDTARWNAWLSEKRSDTAAR